MKRTQCAVVAAVVALTLGVVGRADAAKSTGINNCTTLSAPGSYVLEKSLTAVGDCIVVAADFVTLDLGGQTLQGNGNGSGVTDGGVARKGTVIRDGAVTNFQFGISFSISSIGTVIERVRAISNSFGISVGPNSTITGNTASHNIGDGILAWTGSTVTGNTVTLNNNGIAISGGSTVTGNTATNNTAAGIFASTGSTISGNTATNHGTIGIAGGARMTISNNTATGNTGLGFHFGDCTSANSVSTLIGNTVQNNNGGSPAPQTSSTAGCNLANNAF